MSRSDSIDQSAIRNRITDVLRTAGVPVNPSLPLLATGRQRPPAIVARRMIILYSLTGLAHEARPTLLLRWLEENSLAAELLPSERRYFMGQLSQQDLIDLSWRQESLFTLAWAASLVERLPEPAGECDLGSLFPIIPPAIDVAAFVDTLALRPQAESFYQADLHLCLHWAVRHPEVWSDPKGARRYSLDVIRERRQALEWLLGIGQDWDDIPLDT